MLDLYDELKAVLSALEKAEVPYALCGGPALAVYGHPRATIDIDLLVPSDLVEAAVVSLRSVSFGIDALPKTFAEGVNEIRRVSKLDQDAGELLAIDLLKVTPSLLSCGE